MNKTKTLLLLVLIFLSYNLCSQDLTWLENSTNKEVHTIYNIANPKTESTNDFVSNPDHIISYRAESSINTLADSLEKHNGVEIAVVLLSSVGEVQIKEFAVDLFNHWGLGKKDADNGLLILFVEDQRSVTFETGYGIEGDLPDAICKRIQMECMVPYFKEGNYDEGMIQGVSATIDVLKKGHYEYEIPQEVPIGKYLKIALKIIIVAIILFVAFILIFMFIYDLIECSPRKSRSDSDSSTSSSYEDPYPTPRRYEAPPPPKQESSPDNNTDSPSPKGGSWGGGRSGGGGATSSW